MAPWERLGGPEENELRLALRNRVLRLNARPTIDRTAMSTDDFLATNKPNLKSSHGAALANILFATTGAVIVFVLVPFVLCMLFWMLCLFSIDSDKTDGPAPNASYTVRREWGEEKLRHHFRAAEKWIYQSSQIAKDVGKVTGVAPIGSPNSFGAGFGESWAALNLQVLGDKGEGVLCLPDFCADDHRNVYGFDTGSWTFEKSKRPVFKNGKSWMQNLGIDLLHDQVFEFAKQEDHASVVKTCRLLNQTLIGPGLPSRWFSQLADADRFKLLTLYADSLAETSDKTESANMYVEAAALEFKPLLDQLQDRYEAPKLTQDQIRLLLEQVNALLQKAQALEPNKDNVLKMASWRTLFAYQLQCGTLQFRNERGADRCPQLIRRELKGLFDYAEQLAKRSPYLRSELGAITTLPRAKYARLPEETKIQWAGLPFEFEQALPVRPCEDYCTLHLNPDGGYQAYIGITIKGSNGRSGKLTLLVKENNSFESGLDLFCERPSGPANNNMTASVIRWKEFGKRSKPISLSADTLNRKSEKQL